MKSFIFLRSRCVDCHSKSFRDYVLLYCAALAILASGFCDQVTASETVSKSAPVDLLCEYAATPLGVDSDQPMLFWRIESLERGQYQTAYQVLVASSQELIEQGQGDLWDSGRQVSGQTVHIPYTGKELKTSQRVFWKVRFWDQKDQPSAWSQIASWTMGVVQREDWQGKWIVAPWSSESVLLRREFDAKSGLKRALLHISGLGQHEISINGVGASNHLMAPGWSKYDRTCLYETLDVSSLVHPGENAIGVVLGNGMYHTERRQRFSKFQGTHGPLRLFAQLELNYEDGSQTVIPTDQRWEVSSGPVIYNDIFGGEDYDARLAESGWDKPGFDRDSWTPAVELVRPRGTLRGFSSSAPPMKAIETISSRSTTSLSETREVIDFGQNASFMPRVTVSGPAGSTVRLTHAEVVHEDGNINRRTCGGNRGPAYWQYTKSTNEPETWFPKFFYAGCRYMQVDRLPAKVDGDLPKLDECEAVVVHSASEPIGEFETSNPLINRIRDLVRWAQRSNMVSVLTDCPHREKLGWLEQYHLNGPAIRYEFDVNRIFVKSMRDMADSQLGNGLVPNIAPEYVEFPGTFRAAAEWGSAIILVPWQQYQFTGDTRLLREYYPQMQKYFDYLGSKSTNHIVSEGLGDWYDLGPAERPGHAQLTPPPVTATAFYFYDATVLSRIAEVLGFESDAKGYRQMADRIRAAWLREFRNADGTHATNSQCSNAMALEMGLAEQADRDNVLAALVEDIHNNSNATTAGDVGHRFVLQALANNGHSELIYKMINQDERPGYGYQLKQGATSLTEAWDANHKASHNHFMLGHITEWFYRHLVGIQPDLSAPGFKNIVIAPSPVGELDWARGSYDSIHGPIRVRWDRNQNDFTLQVSIPANTTATVYLPSAANAEISENGVPLDQSSGVKLVERDSDTATLKVESGEFTFETSL